MSKEKDKITTPAETENKEKPQKKEKHNSEKGEIKEIFGSAFEEDISEINELSDVDDEQEEDTDAVNGKRKNGLFFLLGLFILVMAVVGIISTVQYTRDKIDSIVDNTEQKEEFERFIYPIVICDPAPFNENVKLRNELIISSSIWDIILYEDKSKYEANFDNIIVPEVDIEQHAAKLYGSGLSITHQTIFSTEVPFYYDSAMKSYRIPANPQYFTYSPQIESIAKNGNSYVLTVGYISPTPAWLAFQSDEEPEPDKYVEYTVNVSTSGFTLTAIQPSAIQASSDNENGI